jgi:hypothetical protein
MCIEPQYLHAASAFVSCRNCWQCRNNRVNDLVGRCIAETKTSDQVLAVTLTYAGDTTHAQTLVYKDVQDFLKRLRKTKGRKVRYIVAGEYGTKKGRAHWHIILFINGTPVPVAKTKKDRLPNEVYFALTKQDRILWSPWSDYHGTVFVQLPDYGSFAYVLKYCLKDLEAKNSRSHLAMSKKPPLGYQWFVDLAQAHVDAGIAPQTSNYSFRDAISKKGVRYKFQLRGRMKELYLDTFRCLWSISLKGEYPWSDLLEERQDLLFRQSNELIYDQAEWLHRLEARKPQVFSNDPEPDNPQLSLQPEPEPLPRANPRYLFDLKNDIIIEVDEFGFVYATKKGKILCHATNVAEATAMLHTLGYRLNL